MMTRTDPGRGGTPLTRLFLLGSIGWLLSAGQVLAATVGTPIVSSHSWRSGASADPEFGTWRGSRLDVRNVFVAHSSWDAMNKKLTSSTFKNNCTQTPLCVISMAPFPDNMAGQFQQCAGGQFDADHKKYAGLMANVVRGTGIVRLAWEADGGSGHAWQIKTTSNLAPFKSCFRRLAAIYRAAGLRVEWTVSKNCLFDDLLASYPGDDVVDFWGLHYYDSGRNPVRTLSGWLSTAKSHGKLMDVSEWGLWQHGDNTAYVQSMSNFFKANAASIGYENYYENPDAPHRLEPTTKFPKAAALYKQLW